MDLDYDTKLDAMQRADADATDAQATSAYREDVFIQSRRLCD